jgi:hypothetical protein
MGNRQSVSLEKLSNLLLVVFRDFDNYYRFYHDLFYWHRCYRVVAPQVVGFGLRKARIFEISQSSPIQLIQMQETLFF